MIRKMLDSDLDKIDVLEHRLFTSAWSKKDFEYELHDNPYGNYFVYEEDSNVVGYVGVWVIFEQAQITTLGVDTEFQDKGIGSKLLEYAINYADHQGCEVISLEVRVSNEKAIKLYENAGFINVNIRKGYYQDNNEDAYLMVKALGGNL